MIRIDFLNKIFRAFEVNPICALLGPRQCGKTTLARMLMEQYKSFVPENYFDLERASDLARLSEPDIALANLNGLIVIDEIQRMPGLFQSLRVLVDRPNANNQFLILGSASRELIQQSSETLTGRISYLELTPFNFVETGNLSQLWLRGGYPKSYLARDDEISYLWRQEYIRTFLEQDIPNLGFKVSPQNLQRFWMMLSHYHGNIFNASEIGRSMGVSHVTVRSYLDILTDTLMVRQLQPWHANISKRQVKSPKIYFRDSGMLHALLGIHNESELLTHPKLGASWEGVMLEEIIRHSNAHANESYFWATHSDAELDLLILKDGKRLGFEIKYTQAPKLTRSMQIAIDTLELDSLTVIYPGQQSYSLKNNIAVMNLEKFILDY